MSYHLKLKEGSKFKGLRKKLKLQNSVITPNMNPASLHSTAPQAKKKVKVSSVQELLNAFKITPDEDGCFTYNGKKYRLNIPEDQMGPDPFMQVLKKHRARIVKSIKFEPEEEALVREILKDTRTEQLACKQVK